MGRIVVRLQPDRTRCGGLTIHDGRGRVVCGPFAVAGRASDAPAAAHNNPQRSSLFCYGDTPAGIYRVVRILSSGPATGFDPRQYGPNGVIVLDAVSGDAALAEANGRFHIFIQGGAIGRGGRLRSTNGCLRLFDADLKKLLERIRTLGPISCECIEDAPAEIKRTVLVDDSYDEGDPPALLDGRPAASSFAGRQYSRRKVIAVGAATVGSLALGGVFFGRDGAVNWVALGPPDAVAQDYGNPPPQGPAGPAGPATQPFGAGTVPPENANLQPASPESPGTNPSNALQQLNNVHQNTQNAPNAPSPEQQKQESTFNPQGPAGGSAAVTLPPVTSEPPVPQDVSNPQYQQLKGDYDKSEQQYENAARAAQQAQSDWDNARRQPSSVSPQDYQAAQQRAQDAESARQWQEYQRNQAKQKVTTFVLDQNPPPQTTPPKKGGQ